MNESHDFTWSQKGRALRDLSRSYEESKVLLVIVLTKAAPALVIKWSGEYFLK